MSTPHAGSSPDAPRRPPGRSRTHPGCAFWGHFDQGGPWVRLMLPNSLLNVQSSRFFLNFMFSKMQRKKKEKKKQEDHHPLGFCAFAFHSPGRLGWDGMGWMDWMDGIMMIMMIMIMMIIMMGRRREGGGGGEGEALYMLTPDHPPPAELTGNNNVIII